MNIIKLKDIIMPGEEPIAEYFNKYLKGKYAYWIHMRYIVSFEHMSREGYVACEEDINKLLNPSQYNTQYLDIYNDGIVKYIDSVETDKVNSTVILRLKNSYTPDDNITVDELKMFRKWLAQELLKMDQTDLGEQKKSYFTSDETHVLQYYAEDMYDDIIKTLTTFGKIDVSFNTIETSSCGCHHGSNISSLYNTELNICDPINIYRKNIYNKMVDMFSSLDFWKQWPLEFINEFKKYIDNIINCNFTLTKSSWMNEFIDCCCENESEQERSIEILKTLSRALGYIKDEQISGHNNYITDALTKWAQLLYEKMYW